MVGAAYQARVDHMVRENVVLVATVEDLWRKVSKVLSVPRFQTMQLLGAASLVSENIAGFKTEASQLRNQKGTAISMRAVSVHQDTKTTPKLGPDSMQCSRCIRVCS